MFEVKDNVKIREFPLDKERCKHCHITENKLIRAGKKNYNTSQYLQPKLIISEKQRLTIAFDWEDKHGENKCAPKHTEAHTMPHRILKITATNKQHLNWSPSIMAHLELYHFIIR